MSDQWVRAVKAIELLSEAGGQHEAILTLCSRAHHGLVKARAALLIAGNERKEHVHVAPAFWWAEGHEALEQDWARGDFSTWIDKKLEYKVFGVEFDLEGLKAMLPPERAAVVGKELSVIGDPTWVVAMEARRQLYLSNFASPTTADRVLIGHCRLGFVLGRALLMEQSTHGRDAARKYEEREWDIPTWFWQEFTHHGSSAQDWNTATFTGQGSAPDGRSTIKLTGVYFLQSSLPYVKGAGQLEEKASLNKVATGRPAKPWWDDFWCAMWGQIYRGDLNPKNQAQLEQSMSQWITDNDHEASESTLKPLARKMFAELSREDKK